MEADDLTELAAQMDAFSSLVVDGGRIVYERAYKESNLDGVRSRIASRGAGERLTIQRFPDGYKIVISRVLLI